jgi:hypothetical protein
MSFVFTTSPLDVTRTFDGRPEPVGREKDYKPGSSFWSSRIGDPHVTRVVGDVAEPRVLARGPRDRAVEPEVHFVGAKVKRECLRDGGRPASKPPPSADMAYGRRVSSQGAVTGSVA